MRQLVLGLAITVGACAGAGNHRVESDQPRVEAKTSPSAVRAAPTRSFVAKQLKQPPSSADFALVAWLAPACKGLSTGKPIAVVNCGTQLRTRCSRQLRRAKRMIAFGRVAARVVADKTLAIRQPRLWIGAQNCLGATRDIQSVSRHAVELVPVWSAKKPTALNECLRHCELDPRARAVVLIASRRYALLGRAKTQLDRWFLQLKTHLRTAGSLAWWLPRTRTQAATLRRELAYETGANYAALVGRVDAFVAALNVAGAKLAQRLLAGRTKSLVKFTVAARRFIAKTRIPAGGRRLLNRAVREVAVGNSFVTRHRKLLSTAQIRPFEHAVRVWQALQPRFQDAITRRGVPPRVRRIPPPRRIRPFRG